jgi:hypothetical protein
MSEIVETGVLCGMLSEVFRWTAWIDGEPLKTRNGRVRRFRTRDAAEHALAREQAFRTP